MKNKIFTLFASNQHSKIYLIIFLLFLASILEMLGVGLVMPFIALIDSPSLVSENKWFKIIYEYLNTNTYNNFLILLSFFILGFYLVKNLIIGAITYYMSKFFATVEADLTVRLLNKYLHMDYIKYIERNSGHLVNNIIVETSMVFAGLIKPLFIVISDSFVVLAIFLLLVFISPYATIAAIITMGLCGLLFYLPLAKRLKEFGKIRQYHREQMLQWVNQGLGSLKEIIVLGRRQFFVDSFAHHVRTMIGQQTFYDTVVQLPRIVIETFGVIVLVVIVMILLQKSEANSFLPDIALFAMAAFRLMPAINRITSCMSKVKYYSNTLNILYQDLTNIFGEDTENKSFGAKLVNESAKRIDFKDNIKVKNLSFAYPGSSENIFEDLSLVIKKGRSIGIIGASGSGKTSFVDILLGLLPYNTGQILVDNVDIRDNIQDFRNVVSYMPQFVYLVDDTIKRNVAFGVQDSMIDEKLVMECLAKAELAEFIAKQPLGLETIVGERGARLSGGQRQRIGIARALYNKPEILLLDEATSALDPETEAKICATLKSIAKDVTIIAISHNKALTDIADEIYVLQNKTLKNISE